MPTLYPTIKNKYKHAGTSQLERLLHTLAPAYFQLDDRSIKDILAATHRYAELLHFYNDQNVQEGDWTCFWKVETLTFLAVLSTIDTEAVGQEFAALEKEAKEGTEPIKKGYLNAMLFLRKQLLRIDEYYHTLPDSLPFKREMYHLIKKDDDTDADQLADTLATLISYHKEAFQEVYGDSLKHEMYSPFLTDLWSLGVVDAFYDITSSTDYRLDDWENLRQLAKTIQQFMARIVHRANYWFDNNLSTPQLRQPHVALYLAFLRLFEHARREMNDLTRRHLEFFYEQILHLRRQKAVPDDVHLLFQLANNVDQYLVEGGTTLLAGKLNGRNLHFATLEDWVFNKAQVAEIKNTYFDLRAELAAQAHVYASPDVKKVYKNNAEAANEKSVTWRSMGDDGDLPLGEIGFAIASPQLILREGRRKITLSITIDGDIPYALSNRNFELYLSGEEEWVTPPAIDNSSIFSFQVEKATIGTTTTNLTFNILLEEDQPPVDKMSKDFAKETGFYSDWPVLKCQLDSSADDYLVLFNDLRCKAIAAFTIKIEVLGIRENLIVQNDQGVFDGTQKFLPFTGNPRVGSHFYLGSTEVFQKALTSLSLKLDWIAAPENFVSHYKNYVDISLLTATTNPPSTASTATVLSSLFQPPFVNVDFIDRARVNLPVAVVRSGAGASSTRVIVTDVNGEFLRGVVINNDPLLVTYDNGEKPGLPVTTPLTFSYTDLRNNKQYTAREPMPPVRVIGFEGEAKFETIQIDVAGASLVKVVLFRAMQDRSLTSYQREATTAIFKVKDIYGSPISDVSFNDGTNTVVNNGTPGQFTKDNAARITKISAPLKEALTLIPTDVINNYSLFEVTLYPNPILSTPDSGFSVKAADGSALAGVKVSLKKDNQSLSVFSNPGGDYILPVLTGFTPTVIEFEHPDYEVFEQSLTTLPTTSNVQLIVPKKTVRFKQVIGAIKDDVAAALSGVRCNILGRIAPPGITGSNYTTGSAKVFQEDSLQFEKTSVSGTGTNYYPSRMIPFGDTKIDVALFKKSRERSGTTGQIRLTIKDIFGSDIASPVVTLGGTSIPTPGNFSTPGAVIIRAAGFIDFNITVATGRNYEVFLEPNPIQSNTPGTTTRIQITGNISPTPTSGTFSQPVLIKARWAETSGEITSSTYTDSSGAFTIPVSSSAVELEFSHPGFITVVIQETTDNLYSTLNVQLTRLPDNLNSRERRFENKVNLKFFKLGTTPGSKIDASGTINISHVKGVPEVFHKQYTTQSSSIIIEEVAATDKFYCFFEDLSSDAGKRQYLSVVECEGYPEIEVFFLPDRLLRVVKGTARDAYDEYPTQDVPVRLVSGDVSGGLDIYNETYRITKTDVAGNYELQIPATVTSSIQAAPLSGLMNPTLRFLGRDFYALQTIVEDITQSVSSAPIYSFIDVYLNYQKLNRLPLIVGDLVTKRIENEFSININALNLKRDARTQNFNRFTPTLKRGFIRITLDGADFLHEKYPNILTALSILAADSGTNFALPEPPYAPTTNGITLNYTSEQRIDLGAANDEVDQYYHLFAFSGYKNIALNGKKVELVYGFSPFDKPDSTDDDCIIAPANLYLGLKDLTPGTNLSLLFQAQAGTEGSFDDLPPDTDANLLHWSYLAKDNQWLPFSVERILKDTTRGLTRTGIVQLKLPFDMVKENTLLNKELHWIRVAAQEDLAVTPRKTARALPSLIDVRAQAAEARFVPIEDLPDHFIAEKPLPAQSIKRLEISDSNVKKIEQPFPSFNGRIPEAGRAFYQRVSERLRHRDRAVTAWDYERIVLEQFPKVYRAKTLRHTDLVSELAPGHVLVALIPDLRQWDLEKPSKPRFSRGDLDEMADFLRSKTNFFVAQKTAGGGPYLHVENPLYEEIEVKLQVKFKPKVDEEYAKIQLKEALERFIAPWMYDPEQDIAFNRALDRSRLVQFIEMKDYVDAILSLSITHDGVPEDSPLIVPFTSRSVLTTGNHEINPA